MNLTPTEIWLITGIIFVVIEFSTLPSIGFLFLGLGALTSASLMYFYQDLINYQIATVGITSLVWFLALWFPLKKFVYDKTKNGNKESHFNIIGAQVRVVNNCIKPNELGQVLWSGTIMNAKLISSEENRAEINEILYVFEVQGNVLICSKHKIKT